MSKTTPKTVATLIHKEDKRKNIPTAEYQPLMCREEQHPVMVAYERRNRDLDPQLVWRGKDEQDWSDLVVHAPPLYIQEKVHPKVLIDDLRRLTTSHQPPATSTSSNSISFPTSTACPTRPPRPSSTSTTPTGPTA